MHAQGPTWRLAALLQFAGLTVNLQNRADGEVRGPMPAGVVGLDGLALFEVKDGSQHGAGPVFGAAELLRKIKGDERALPRKVTSRVGKAKAVR